MIKCILAAMLVAVACTGSVRAETYHIYGHGAASCGKFISDHERNVRSPDGPEGMAYNSDTVWIGGYLTAFNEYSPTHTSSILAGTDLDGAMQWLVNYCRAHPVESLGSAASALVDSLLHRHK